MEKTGGANRDRTDDLLNAIQALSQLSYGPTLFQAASLGHDVRVLANTRRCDSLQAPFFRKV